MSSFSCNVCGAILGSMFSLKRHLGVKHKLDVNGRSISSARQDYLRLQSAKHYVPIGNRNMSLTNNKDPENEASALPNSEDDAGKSMSMMELLMMDFIRTMLAKAINQSDESARCSVNPMVFKTTKTPSDEKQVKQPCCRQTSRKRLLQKKCWSRY